MGLSAQPSHRCVLGGLQEAFLPTAGMFWPPPAWDRWDPEEPWYVEPRMPSTFTANVGAPKMRGYKNFWEPGGDAYKETGCRKAPGFTKAKLEQTNQMVPPTKAAVPKSARCSMSTSSKRHSILLETRYIYGVHEHLHLAAELC